MRGVALLILLSWPCCHLTQAQSGFFKNYSVEDGLSQSQVNCIYQGSRGYLWFGTDAGGLCRFDGKNFRCYTTADGLSDNLINVITEDSIGRLWLGTYKGMSIFDGKEFIRVPEPLDKIADNQIRSMCRDGNGKLWIGTEMGAWQLDGKRLVEIEELKGKIVNDVFEDKKGNIWFATNVGVIRLKGWIFTQYTTAHGLSDQLTYSIEEDQHENLIVATSKGICRFNGHKFIPTGEQNQIVRRLFTDSKGRLWLGTTGAGVYIIEGESTRHFTMRQGLSNDRIMDIYEDAEGNIWIGTEGGGVNKYSSARFMTIAKEDGLLSDLVLSILEDSNGDIWFGTEKGVSKWIRSGNEGAVNRFQHFDDANGMATAEVWSMIEDKQGNIWMSTYGRGVFKYDGQRFYNYTERDGLSSDNVRCVYEDSRGNIWIGTAMGLNKFDGKSFTVYTEDDGLKSHRILVAMEDSQGNMWFACSGGGLSKLTANGFVNYTEDDGVAHNTVLSLEEDDDGFIWCGNYGGITRIDQFAGKKQGIRNINRKDGLSSNTVYLVIKDNNGNLFVGTNNGIDKVDLRAFNNNNEIIIKHYGREEGFSGIETNTHSRYKDKYGNIWFGTVDGAIRYNPKEDKINKIQPKTHLTGISLFFERFDWGEYASKFDSWSGLPLDLTLPYNQNHVTFDFVGLSHTVPEKVRYSVKLDGFDKTWSPVTDQSFATYSNLPAGSYKFMVKASNNDGIWNDEPTTFSFVVAPPFWKTWWFYTLCGAILLIGFYGFVQYRLARLRKAERMLKVQVQIKTRELREEKEKVEQQHQIIEKKNKDITASIRYAKRIQDAILPIQEKLNDIMSESFILFKPKDIVSGDFYWFIQKNGVALVAAVDCTGHGVPGAFMSLIGNEMLNEIVNVHNVTNPSKVLEQLHEGVVSTLKKDEKHSSTVDGMDIALVAIDKKKGMLEFASSGRPLVLVRNGKAEMFRSGKYPIGLVIKKERVYQTQSITLQPDDAFYIFSDGYCDQFGGPNDEKFMMENFKDLLIEVQGQDMAKQKQILDEKIEEWKGSNNQLDDILVIGMKYS